MERPDGLFKAAWHGFDESEVDSILATEHAASAQPEWHDLMVESCRTGKPPSVFPERLLGWIDVNNFTLFHYGLGFQGLHRGKLRQLRVSAVFSLYGAASRPLRSYDYAVLGVFHWLDSADYELAIEGLRFFSWAASLDVHRGDKSLRSVVAALLAARISAESLDRMPLLATRSEGVHDFIPQFAGSNHQERQFWRAAFETGAERAKVALSDFTKFLEMDRDPD